MTSFALRVQPHVKTELDAAASAQARGSFTPPSSTLRGRTFRASRLSPADVQDLTAFLRAQTGPLVQEK